MTDINYLPSAIDASDCISNAWELVKRRPWLYIGVALLTLILIGFIPFVSVFLMGPVMGGFAFIVLKDMRNEEVDFGMMFKGFDKFVPLMFMGLIQAIPGIVFQCIQLVSGFSELVRPSETTDTNFFQTSAEPFAFTGLTVAVVIMFIGYWLFCMVWSYALTFAIPLIMEHGVSVGDAIKLSFGAVFSNLGGLFVLGFLGSLVGLLGLVSLCVGIFVALPVMFASQVFAYRQVFPDFGEPSLWPRSQVSIFDEGI
jgi:hypothetical protein